MTDQIKVSVEVDKLKAEQSLRDLSRQLNGADNLIDQMRRSGIEWAADFKSATETVREEVSKLGTIASKSTNDMIKGNNKFSQSIENVTTKVSQLQQALAETGKNFRIPLDASKLAVTAGLRDDDAKRRSQYMSQLQTSYQKEQAALGRHNSSLESLRKQRLAQEQLQYQNREKAREEFARAERESLKRQQQNIQEYTKAINFQKATEQLKRIKQLYLDLQKTDLSKTRFTAPLGGAKAVAELNKYNAAIERKKQADRSAAQTGQQLSNSTKRLGVAALTQAGQVNKLGSAWGLAKQRMRESISVANTFQTAARGITAVFGTLLFKVAEFVKTAPSLSSDMLGFRNALQLVTGSQEEAAGLLSTAIEIATRLKLSITAVTKEYSKFTNSATIAGLSVERATRTFENFSIAARVLNLSQQRTSGMFLALEQMISKGRVSMEELRRQLGEHIPGALNLAAEAMGYGKDELGKFIKEVSLGKVVSLELVENLGKLVRDRTIKLLPASLEKWSAAVQNLINAFDMLRLRLGTIIANFFGPMVDGLGNLIRAFNKLLGPIEVLEGTATQLSQGLTSVTVAAKDTSSSILQLVEGETNLAEVASTTTQELYSMEESMNAASLAGVAMLGTVGSAGLGGAFAVLRKSIEWVKTGLKNFAAPFILLGSKLKPLISALGTGGLLKVLFKLKLAWQVLILTIEAAIARMAVFILMNPYTAAAAALVALSAGIYLVIDGHDELEEKQKVVTNNFKDMAEKVKTATDELEVIKTTMADFGQVEIVVNANEVQERLNIFKEGNKALEEGLKIKKDEVGFWDEQLDKVGYVTDDMANYRQELITVRSEQFLNNQAIQEGVDKTKQLKQEAEGVTEAFKAIKDASAAFVDNFKIEELKLKISLVGANEVKAQIDLVSLKAQKEIAKLNAENGNPVANAEAIKRINAERDLEIQLIRTTAAQKSYEQAIKAFVSLQQSLSSSIESTITSLEQQAMTIGKTGYELDQLNAQFKVAALTEKALELESKAVTAAQREQAAAFRDNIQTVAALHQNLNLLKEAERQRTEQLKEQKKAMEEFNTLRKEGQEILNKTLPLEQQYSKAWDELLPKLKAAGATQQQLATAAQQLWTQTIQNSNNGLKSLEAISEEFAKGMQENFSNFFFDVMQGDFDNLTDSFTNMLQRMVAEAIATNLAQYIMGPGGGGGLMDSLLGSPIVSSLFNIAPSAPTAGLTGLGASSGIMSMGSGFVNLPGAAYGADFKVPGTGSTDSQIVAFKATPGERVLAIPPSKQGYQDMGSTGQSTVINFNVTTPDINSFNASRSQLEVDLRSMVQNAGRNI